MTTSTTLSEGDKRYVQKRLANECGVDMETAQNVLAACEYIYARAYNFLEKQQREREAERLVAEAARREREEAWAWEQAKLVASYEIYVLPLIRSWLRGNPKVDPLRIAEDFLHFLDEIGERLTLTMETVDGRKQVTLTEGKGRWKAGRGYSDNVREAILFAFYNLYGEEE